MNKNEYLLKLKGKLIYKLPAASLRELLTETDELLREGNDAIPHDKNFGTYQEFAKEITPEKNYRCILAGLFAIAAIISHILFWSVYISFTGTKLQLRIFSIMAIVFTAIALWLIFGIDCFWESYYERPVRKLLKEQFCILLAATVMQLVILFVLPYVFMAGYRWNEPLYRCIVAIFLLLGIISFVRLFKGRYQSYFSLVQLLGILYSLPIYTDYLYMEEFIFFTDPFIMWPYIASLITGIVLFCLLTWEVENGRSN